MILMVILSQASSDLPTGCYFPFFEVSCTCSHPHIPHIIIVVSPYPVSLFGNRDCEYIFV